MNARSVLISGAGIAGPALAFWLSEAGFAPTIVEQAPALRAGGYVVDFWGLGYDLAERMGLTDAINRIGYHMREMRIVDDRSVRVAGLGIEVLNELTGGRFVTIGRSDLSRLLFEKAEGRAEVIFGDEITGLHEHAHGVVVQFKRSGERQFGLVVGTDGLHSNVRRLAFGPQDKFEHDLGYRIAAFEARGYRPRDENVYVIYNAPGRMLGRVALHDDRTLFLFVFAADADQTPDALHLSGQKSMLREKYSGQAWECDRILDELDRTAELYFDRVSQIKMEHWSNGRIVLAGDAAFCISLTGGQGSALAITAAYVLAGELANANGRHLEAYGNYEKRLRTYIASKQRGARRFAAAFAPRTRWGLFLRNQITRAASIPALARYAFGRDIIDTLKLPNYDFR